jgi:hypothetical protein
LIFLHLGAIKKSAIRTQGPDSLLLRPQNERLPKQHRKSTAYHRRMMPDAKHEYHIFKVDMVDVTPQEQKPHKERNRKNRWGESSKCWRHSGWKCRCERCRDDRQYDLNRERERTSQAMREWREEVEDIKDEVDPWEELELHNEYMLGTADRTMKWFDQAGYFGIQNKAWLAAEIKSGNLLEFETIYDDDLYYDRLKWWDI